MEKPNKEETILNKIKKIATSIAWAVVAYVFYFLYLITIPFRYIKSKILVVN